MVRKGPIRADDVALAVLQVPPAQTMPWPNDRFEFGALMEMPLSRFEPRYVSRIVAVELVGALNESTVIPPVPTEYVRSEEIAFASMTSVWFGDTDEKALKGTATVGVSPAPPPPPQAARRARSDGIAAVRKAVMTSLFEERERAPRLSRLGAGISVSGQRCVRPHCPASIGFLAASKGCMGSKGTPARARKRSTAGSQYCTPVSSLKI